MEQYNVCAEKKLFIENKKNPLNRLSVLIANSCTFFNQGVIFKATNKKTIKKKQEMAKAFWQENYLI